MEYQVVYTCTYIYTCNGKLKVHGEYTCDKMVDLMFRGEQTNFLTRDF